MNDCLDKATQKKVSYLARSVNGIGALMSRFQVIPGQHSPVKSYALEEMERKRADYARELRAFCNSHPKRKECFELVRKILGPFWGEK